MNTSEYFVGEASRTDKMLQGIIEQSASAFSGFVNRTGGDLVKLFLFGWEKVYSDKPVDGTVALPHVSLAGAISVPWQTDSDVEPGRGLSSSKKQAGGKHFRLRGCGKGRGRR